MVLTTTTFFVTKYWYCLINKRLTQQSFKLGQHEIHRETKVIRHVQDLDAAPLEWKINDIRPLASVTTAAEVSRSELQWDLASMLRTSSWQEQTSSMPCMMMCQDPQTEFALLRESLGVSRTNHVLRIHGHIILKEKEGAAKIFDEVGQWSRETLSRDYSGLEQATLRRAQYVASPAHFGAPIPAKPPNLNKIQDAATARLIQNQLLLERLDSLIEAATAVYLEALGDSEKPTARLFCKSEPRKQTSHGSKQFKDTMAQPL